MRDREGPTWQRTTIKESAYLRGRIGWQGLRAAEFTDQGPFLVTGTDFRRNGDVDWATCYHVSEERFQEAPYIHLRNSDVLVTKDGTIGKVAYVRDCPAKAVLNSGIFLVRSIDGAFDQRFLYYVLNSEVFDEFLRLNLAGSTITHLYQHVFERFEFPVPPLAVQGRLAEILSTLDAAIEQTEALIEKTRAIKAGLMHDLLTRGVTKDDELRPTLEEAPLLYKQSQVGPIPREWKCERLENLLAKTSSPMRSGPFGSALLKDELVASGVPLLGIDNIQTEFFANDYRRFVTPQKFVELNRYAVFPGDVVITIMGTVGRCCVVPYGVGDALSSKHLWAMTFDKKRILPQLVCWQLNHAAWVKAAFARKSQGAVMEAIQSATLRDLRLPVPPIEEQERIAVFYAGLQETLSTAAASVEKLNLTKRGVMRDLLTERVQGALRMRDYANGHP